MTTAMTKFEIVKAKRHHCGKIIRQLRKEHQEALLGVRGARMRPHESLREVFDDSCFRKAWLIDGKLAGLGGVTGPAIATTGFVWLALTDAATAHPLAIAREVKQQLRDIMATRRELVTIIFTQDRKSVRFAELLGFEPTADAAPEGKAQVFVYRRKTHSFSVNASMRRNTSAPTQLSGTAS